MKKIQWTKQCIAMLAVIAICTTAAIAGAVRRIPEKAVQSVATGITAPVTQPATELPTEPPTEPEATTRPPAYIRATSMVYINLPQSSDYWRTAGEDLKSMLHLLSYRVTLEYADDDSVKQAQQVARALEKDVRCIIIAPVESAALCQVMDSAGQAGISVISYDRLLMDTGAASYHISYDYQAMGAALGQHVVEKKSLNTASAETPLRLELLMGSPESTAELSIYYGILEQLQPYLDSGVLTVPSGRVAFEDTCIPGQDPEAAAALLKRSIKESYKKKQFPDIICTVSHAVADACVAVLEESGCPAESWPLITVVDGSSSQHWQTGKLSVSLERSAQLLNDRCLTLVDDLLTGKTPAVDDTLTYFNHVTVVPAVVCGFETKLPPEAAEAQPTEPQ